MSGKLNCSDVGKVFGRLTVLGFDESKLALCQCACGSEIKRYRINALRTGNTKSCGCLAREKQSAVGRSSKTHGMTGSSIYKTWTGMRGRCGNPKSKDYHDYGAKGVFVCDRWADFSKFHLDMGERPSPAHTIDRIDLRGPYSPENCRWATKTEQTRNREIAIVLTFAGQSLPLQVWCDRYGAAYSTVHSRIFKHGWPLELALFAPKNFRLAQWRQIACVANDFPIRDQPGDDETLAWAGLPGKVEVKA